MAGQAPVFEVAVRELARHHGRGALYRSGTSGGSAGKPTGWWWTQSRRSRLLPSPAKDLIQVLYDEVYAGGRLGACVVALARESLSREKLEVSARSFARVLRAVVCGDRDQCSLAPSRRFIELAIQLLGASLVCLSKRGTREREAGQFGRSYARWRCLGPGEGSWGRARPASWDLRLAHRAGF